MKRFALAALILGSLAACTKSNIQYELTEEISLQPVAEKATKAAYTDTAYGEGAPAFNVWAWWANVEPGKSIAEFLSSGNIDSYIDKGEFVHRNNGSWGGTIPYYWPPEGSLVFAGYSPAETLGGTFTYDIQNGDFKVEDYIQSSDIAQTVDLMWFDRTGISYNSNRNKNSNSQDVNGVPVIFHHALSWLEFRVVRNDNVPDNWLVTELDLTDIETKADFNSNGTPQWTGQDVPHDIRVWSGSYLAQSTDKVLESTPAGVIVIPQECEGKANLKVTYNLKKYDGTEDSWLRAQTVTLPLTAGTDENSWLPGKKYVYTIVFGNNEIRIAPTVTDWVDEENLDIEVQ